ncbi:MAG: hypothetical protein PUG84_03275 [Peptoniphilaceae bacterium]|uniref:hypothetical protein n=1 Tax=Peptoniphilus sp. TaxID=1971214 RepID=UPI002977950F|nr:hypothetical protein [Peptoniphilus sp.]MDD7352465.1 hypothetical protein [Peptoniphilaceae bacterium]MDY3902416.1 hypothetical protein [Peptoniphilus sp.]
MIQFTNFEDFKLLLSKLEINNKTFLIYGYKEESYPNIYFEDSVKDHVLFKFLIISDLGYFYFIEKYSNDEIEKINELNRVLDKEMIINKNFNLSNENKIII